MIDGTNRYSGYMSSRELVGWGLANLRIKKPKGTLPDKHIREVIRWVGICAVDTIFTGESKPILGRIGIGLMLTITLLEFPEYYVKYELAQFN